MIFRQATRAATASARAKGEKLNPKERLHEPYGEIPVKQLAKHDVLRWLTAHKDWSDGGGRRTAIQALKRALNWGVDMGLISKNPIKGYPVKQPKKRLTYLTPEQEQAIYELAHPSFALAVKVCIRTGARYGCEFAALSARHVVETDKGMIWRFAAAEAKSRKKERRILIPKDIAEIVPRATHQARKQRESLSQRPRRGMDATGSEKTIRADEAGKISESGNRTRCRCLHV